MSEIRIFDPALCCATGVCGVDLDQELVNVSADIDWVKRQGGDIARYNLASEPTAFASRENVRAFLQLAGSAGLPLVLVDGLTVLAGSYPTRAQLAGWAGISDSSIRERVDPGPGRAELSLAPAGPSEGCCGSSAGSSDATAAVGCC